MSVRLSRLLIAAGVIATLLVPRVATAGIISIKNIQSCGVFGLDISTATVRNGVHCDAGDTPFLLSGVLNGTTALLVGDDSTPSWNLKNDTGAALTSLMLYFAGTLAGNAFIDMQVSGTTLFAACQTTTSTGVIHSAADCGSGDKTTIDPALALQLVWSSGTGVADGASFNLATASFAHSGADAGCFSGQASCTPVFTVSGITGSEIGGTETPVPEPATLSLLGLGLGAGLIRLRRRRRQL